MTCEWWDEVCVCVCGGGGGGGGGGEFHNDVVILYELVEEGSGERIG